MTLSLRSERMAEEKKELTQKKQKGKNWYTIMAPPLFRERELCEIPATDPKYLKGRNIEMGLEELTGDYKKFARFPAAMKLKVTEVTGNRAKTIFGGYEVSKDLIFRVTRKRTQKIDLTEEYKTKDGWNVQITGLVILNRNAYTSIQKSVRKLLNERLKEMVTSVTMEEFLKDLLNRVSITQIKKEASKIYPARVVEITKIEVLSRPE